MPRVLLIVLLLVACGDTARTEEVPIIPADQRAYADSVNGCAPATVLNLLKFGGLEYAPVLEALVGGSDEVRMRFLVDRYFRNRPSGTTPGLPRWGIHGIECEDLATGIDELLDEHGLKPFSARYLDLKPGESEDNHLLRARSLIETSLAAGTPPILSLRSFHVKRRAEKEDEPEWESGINHYVLVTGLRGEAGETGFEIAVIDPWKGRRTVIFLHREGSGRSFRALKGNGATGTWLDGRPFLQALAPEVPTLRPANLEWHERYLVVANHLIGRL